MASSEDGLHVYPPNISRQSEEQHAEELAQLQRYEDFTTIDWIEDSIFERNRRLRKDRDVHATARLGPNGQITVQWLWSQVRKAVRAGQSWIVVSLTGVFIGLTAGLVSITTEWLSDIKNGYCSDGWWVNRDFCCWEMETNGEEACHLWHPWSSSSFMRWIIYSIFAIMFSFTAAHLVRSLAKYAAGSGISEIKCILAGFIMKGYLGIATLLIKSITLPLVIASGLSVGKEGPSVHVACCIGNVIAHLFSRFSRSQSKMREILTAASAAGVAVAFGSPIGGVLFSIEEMSQTFNIKTMWRSFFCALVATVTLSAINPFRTGKLVLFQVTYDRDWHFFEIIFFVIIGVFGGLYGAAVVKFNMQVAAFRRKYLANYGIAEAVALATLTAIVGYPNRFLRIDMTEMMAILFRECESGGDFDNICQTSVQWRVVNSLFLATFARFGLVIISYGCKVPAGIFVPSMAIGATFGRMVGIIVKALYQAYGTTGIFSVCDPDLPCITPGTYAFLGAAATLSGVMRITVTVVVIMFELTGALTYILPTMIVLLVTKAVGDFLNVRGIADEMIQFNGYPFLEKEDHAFHVPVSRVMRRKIQTLPATGLRLQDLDEILTKTDVKGYPIVSADDKRTLMGYVGRTELRYVLEKARNTRNVDANTLCLFESDGSHVGMGPPGAADEPIPMSPAPALGIDEEEVASIIRSSANKEVFNLWPWVNQVPLAVAPQLPLEIVMQLFKRMGPRVILVEQRGSFSGLITVKDVLRYIAVEQEYTPAWDARTGGLHEAQEEAWSWTTNFVQHNVDRARTFLRR